MLQFDKTLLMQFFNLLILLIILRIFLFKPVLAALRKRQDTIRNLAVQAEENRSAAEGLEKRYEEDIKQKQQPIVDERDSRLKEVHAASMKVVEEARRELTAELAKVKDTVKQEAEKTLEVLKAESDRLSLEIVQKIMRGGA